MPLGIVVFFARIGVSIGLVMLNLGALLLCFGSCSGNSRASAMARNTLLGAAILALLSLSVYLW